MATIGVELCTHEYMPSAGRPTLKFKFWDTSGNERFRSLGRQYYQRANGVVLVFDVCDRPSFDNVEHWLDEIISHAPENVERILIGNKIDKEHERVVT